MKVAILILTLFLISCNSKSPKIDADISSVDKESFADHDREEQDLATESENDFDVSDSSDPDNEVPDIQFDEDNEDNESYVQDIEEVSDMGSFFSDEYPDEDYAIVMESNCEMSDDCAFDNSWILPEENWESWAYLKVVGEIGETIESACGESGYKVKNLKDPKEKDQIYITKKTGDSVNVSSTNKTTLEASYYDGGHPKSSVWYFLYMSITLNLSFSTDLIPNMKESGARETDFGPLVSLKQNFRSEMRDFGGTEVLFSKSCTIGIPKFKNDLPAGNMHGCFANNIDGSEGEYLKMMFRMEIEDDKDKIIEYTNTRSDGSIAVPGDDDFKPYCFCLYDGKLICYHYDGIKEYYERYYL
ncbi:MAG TPA: hypothetical protein VLJ60_09230 [bacterium]|nr:hypothetical protein [bacterium]